MLLRLYREPYFDAGRNGRMRLLFEADAAQQGDSGEGVADFYLYIWVRTCSIVCAFQAVLENEHVLNYDEEGHLVYGRISTGPVNRMVVPDDNSTEHARIAGILGRAHCPVFGLMIGSVRSCLVPGITPALTLAPAEAKLCRALAHGWRKKNTSP